MLEIKNLSKAYKKKQVLKNISLSAHDGEIIGIVGANGSGKSTLLFALASLFPESAYVPQDSVLIEELSGLDNLRLWYEKSSLKSALSSESPLQILGLNSLLNMTVSKMSGGMKKRLSIACALAKNSKILLLDEPGSALDIPCKEKLHEYYKKFALEGGIIILSSHDYEELSLCTRLLVLKDGFLSPYEYNGDFHALSALLSD
jgi:ABC-2 type transport system ATP-binding protein